MSEISADSTRSLVRQLIDTGERLPKELRRDILRLGDAGSMVDPIVPKPRGSTPHPDDLGPREHHEHRDLHPRLAGGSERSGAPGAPTWEKVGEQDQTIVVPAAATVVN